MRSALLVAIPFALFACGSDSGGGSQEADINLTANGAVTASGITPINITVPSGGQIHFFNKDTAAHQISSSSCGELNSPRLAAGQDFLTTVTGGPKSCSFEDSLNPTSAAFSGNISVAAAGTPGGGY